MSWDWTTNSAKPRDLEWNKPLWHSGLLFRLWTEKLRVWIPSEWWFIFPSPDWFEPKASYRHIKGGWSHTAELQPHHGCILEDVAQSTWPTLHMLQFQGLINIGIYFDGQHHRPHHLCPALQCPSNGHATPVGHNAQSLLHCTKPDYWMKQHILQDQDQDGKRDPWQCQTSQTEMGPFSIKCDPHPQVVSASVICSCPSVICSCPSVICSSPSVICSSPSVICSCPSVICSSPSVICSSPSVICSCPFRCSGYFQVQLSMSEST